MAQCIYKCTKGAQGTISRGGGGTNRERLAQDFLRGTKFSQVGAKEIFYQGRPNRQIDEQK